MRNEPFLRFRVLKEICPAPLPAVIIPVLAPFCHRFAPGLASPQLLLLGAIRAPGDSTVMAALLVMGLAGNVASLTASRSHLFLKVFLVLGVFLHRVTSITG